MVKAFGLNKTRVRYAAALAILAGTAAYAQQDSQESPSPAPSSTSALRLPANPELFGTAIPNVVKATAIVNGEVITQTDIDQRLALLAIANGGQIPAGEVESLRQQVLRNLIDETLEIQAADTEKIEVKDADIDRTVARVAQNVKQTPDQLATYLGANHSSIKSLRRQIQAEIAWQRLQRAKIESGVSVGDDEVKAVLDRMNASKGTEEYRVGEIFLSSNPGNQAEVAANATRIIDQLKNGASFAGYARQYSEASTAAVGGDLGWVRPEQLPAPLAATLRQMGPGTISNPIPVAGGISILAVQDTRKILTADPRDAVLSLKQIALDFPKGTSEADAKAKAQSFADAVKTIHGCGEANAAAKAMGATVVDNDQIQARQLPGPLQQAVLQLNIGQTTPPYGSLSEGVRVLMLCGRDDPKAQAGPNLEDIQAQLEDDRVGKRWQRYLRDLRRDAVIEYDD